MRLNPQQYAAVNAPLEGVHLVQALAGSGKTTLLRHRTKYLLRTREQQGDYCSKVCVMAFNKSVRDTLEEKFLEDLTDIENKRVKVYTFHGKAYYLVNKFYSQHLPRLKARVDIQANTSHLLTQTSDWLHDKGIYLKNSTLKVLLGLEEKCVNLNLTLKDLFAIDPQLVNQLGMDFVEAQHYIDKMHEFRLSTGKLVFTDLLPLANSLPDVCFQQVSFDDLLVDELQDLNYQQRQLIHRMIPHSKQFTGVGDPWQSIYSFQGCDELIFTRLQNQYPKAKIYPLTTNYRCTDEILDLANKVLENDLGATEKLSGTSKVGEYPKAFIGTDGLIQWINNQKLAGHKWSDIAILYRARSHTPELEIALAEAGVPFTVDNNSFFEQSVVQDILAYFYLIYHPKPDYGYFRHIVNHFRSIGPATAEIIWADTKGKINLYPSSKIPRTIKPEHQKDWFKFVDTIRDYYNLAKTSNPAELAKRITTDLYDRWAFMFGDNQDTLKYYMDIADVFCQWTERYGVDGFRIIQTIELRAQGKSEQEDTIRVTTVHKSKGREWPCVAVWGLSDGLFPMSKGLEDEEKRLLYVATTRAQQELALVGLTSGDRKSTLLRHVP